MSAYDTSVQIQSFSGLDQTGDGYNKRLEYAVEMENVNTQGGQFQPFREGKDLDFPLTSPIGTLACLHRQHGFPDETKDLLIAFSGGKAYTRTLNGGDEWAEVQKYELVEGERVYSSLTLSTDYQSWVTYEVSVIDGAAQDSPVDIFLFTNGTDGMFCLYGNDCKVEAVATPEKFSVISRSNERIWGAGVDGMPDWLFYSKPFDPFDWDANEEEGQEADGGGEFRSPSWDGDYFLGLFPYGSQLLAFKKNAIWKILGTDPGEFIVREQFGPGTVVPQTIATSGAYTFMLGYTGLVRYDGTQSVTFRQDSVRGIFNRVNYDAVSQACAVMDDRTYMLALPIDGSTVNNAILSYNSQENMFTLRTDIYVKAFLQIEDRILYTSSKAPGRVLELCDEGKALPVYWESGMQDLGLKSSVKSSFNLYFMAEAETPFMLVVGIQTDKKLKEKILQVKPGKATKTTINVQGRFFKLKIHTRTVIPFKIVGGFKLDMELDPD